MFLLKHLSIAFLATCAISKPIQDKAKPDNAIHKALFYPGKGALADDDISVKAPADVRRRNVELAPRAPQDGVEKPPLTLEQREQNFRQLSGSGVNYATLVYHRWGDECLNTRFLNMYINMDGTRNDNITLGDVKAQFQTEYAKTKTVDPHTTPAYRPYVRQALVELAGAFWNHIQQVFDASLITVPQNFNYTVFPVLQPNATMMWLRLFAHGRPNASFNFNYAMQQTNNPPPNPNIDDLPYVPERPVSLAAVGLNYVGNVITDLFKFIDNPNFSTSMDVPDALTFLAAIQTLRRMSDSCFHTIEKANKISPDLVTFPITGLNATDLYFADQCLKSGNFYSQNGVWEPYDDLVDEMTDSTFDPYKNNQCDPDPVEEARTGP